MAESGLLFQLTYSCGRGLAQRFPLLLLIRQPSCRLTPLPFICVRTATRPTEIQDMLRVERSLALVMSELGAPVWAHSTETESVRRRHLGGGHRSERVPTVMPDGVSKH